MIDAELIEGKGVATFEGNHTLVSGLTWEGHDFLDAARNDKIWEKADEAAKKEGTRLNDLSFEVSKSLLVASAKQLFNLQ